MGNIPCGVPKPHLHNLPLANEAPLYRKLLYGLFISGDGNFHLQRRRNKAGASLQESFFGDGGFWAPQTLFDAYVAKLGATTASAHDKVRPPI